MGASQCCDQSQGQAVVSSVSSEGPHPSRGLGGARPVWWLPSLPSCWLWVPQSPLGMASCPIRGFSTPRAFPDSTRLGCGLFSEEEGSAKIHETHPRLAFLCGLGRWDDRLLATVLSLQTC